jgi:hypothetical protein
MLSEPCFHRGGERRVVVDVGQVVFPRAIAVQGLGHLGHQLPQARARVLAGAQVMPIAKAARARVRAGTISREQAQLNARLLGSPRLNGVGLRNPIVLHHPREASVLCRRRGGVQRLQQRPEQRMGVARPSTVVHGACGDIQRAGQVVLLLGPRCHDRHWGPLGPPRVAHRGQPREIPFVRTHQRFAPRHVLIDPAEAGQAVHAVRVVVLSDPCGPPPHPVHLVDPAAHRLS